MVDLVAKYQRYAEYKDSGVEALGIIPKGWSVIRGKFLFSEINERSENGDETLLSVSEYYGVKPRGESISEGDFLSRAESLEGYKKCYVNDLVMNIMLAWKRGLGISKYNGIVSPAYSVFRFNNKVSPDFMHYLLRTEEYIKYFKTRSTGIIDSRLRLYPESFGDIFILLPFFEEQTQIANFLDHETAKIDSLIEKQKQLIQLLKEKRQAVISNLIRVQNNEPTIKLKYAVEILAGYSFSSSGFQTEDENGIALLRGINVGVGSIKWDECVWWSKADTNGLGRYLLKEGDLVFGMDRPWISSGARVAEVKQVDLPSFLVQRVARIRCIEGFYQPYIKLVLGSKEFKSFIESDLTGVSVPHISTDQIISFEIRDLTYTQQVVETDKVINFIVQVKDLINKAQSAIQLMQERRTALISAAVTGKIDVRNWQNPIDAKTELSA